MILVVGEVVIMAVEEAEIQVGVLHRVMEVARTVPAILKLYIVSTQAVVVVVVVVEEGTIVVVGDSVINIHLLVFKCREYTFYEMWYCEMKLLFVPLNNHNSFFIFHLELANLFAI